MISTNASHRLKVTAKERREAGEELARELQKFFTGLDVSKIDGTIQVHKPQVPVRFVLRRLGFSSVSEDQQEYVRHDMDIQVRTPEDGDAVIYVTPHF